MSYIYIYAIIMIIILSCVMYDLHHIIIIISHYLIGLGPFKSVPQVSLGQISCPSVSLKISKCPSVSLNNLKCPSPRGTHWTSRCPLVSLKISKCPSIFLKSIYKLPLIMRETLDGVVSLMCPSVSLKNTKCPPEGHFGWIGVPSIPLAGFESLGALNCQVSTTPNGTVDCAVST